MDTKALKAIIQEVYHSENHVPKLAAPDSYFDYGWYKAYFDELGPNVVDIVTTHNYFLGRGVTGNCYPRIESLFALIDLLFSTQVMVPD